MSIHLIVDLVVIILLCAFLVLTLEVGRKVERKRHGNRTSVRRYSGRSDQFPLK